MLQLSTAMGALARLGLVLCLALPATAQQFQVQSNAIPGPLRWSEGVEAVDVDNDGDLDLLFADGDGFSTPGTQRQNVLIINKLMETGPGIYADESLTRLGTNLSNSKGVCTGDVNGDGWVDLLFVNAFNTDPPFLYINQGASGSPGFFTMESAARGFTTNYSSAGGQFGDVDTDGDLDLILADSGASFFGGAGGRPHLFLNDGNGFFTEDVAGMGASLKNAHMDVQLFDADNDFDLDFLGACRASNGGGFHYFMRNNGNGSFTDASTLVPNGSANVYEIEVGDLDGDDDLDLFYVSLAGFSEGAARNNLIGTGTLGWTSLGGLAGAVDDNEIVLLDYDMDGDQDPFVGSLGATEALWRNDGAFAFVNQSAQIQSISDPTLDMTAADLDNDGDYDLITSQGEGNPALYRNQIYLNNGPADTRAPRLTALRTIPATFPDPVRVLAKVQDEVYDDAVQYVTGFARYVVNAVPQSAGVTVDGAGFTPNALVVPAGTTVTWTHAGGPAQSVTSTTLPYGYDSGSFSSGSYSYTFVSPGIYSYMSTPTGALGTVTVTGTASETDGIYVGGGMHRFELPSNGAQVCYELWFRDWPGNESVGESVCRSLVNPFPTFCDNADGSLASCPCSNPGNPNSGCDIQQGTGGVEMTVVAQETTPDNRVTATGSGFPTGSAPAAIVIRGTALDPSSPVVFGDGLRCVGVPLVRLGAAFAAGGTTTHTFGHGSMAGTGAFYYQIWFRNTPAMFCTPDAFNLSNGREIAW